VRRRHGRSDRQRQRQPGAEPDQFARGGGLGHHPFGAEPGRQKFSRFRLGEQVEVEQPGPLGHGETGQLAAAGHDHQAAGRAGQQRPHLGGVPGVVEHDQQPPAGHQTEIQSGLRIWVLRNPFGGHLQGIQESPDRGGRAHRRTARIEPAQVHVQLPVREAVRNPMRPLQREGRLAHARGPADRGDHQRPGCVLRHLIQEFVELLQFAGPPGELRHGRGKLPGHHRRSAAARTGTGRRVVRAAGPVPGDQVLGRGGRQA
jgi:hypothetical protein